MIENGLTSIFGFILLLAPTVLLHELGHFGAARAFGVRVYEFALGFGPVLWRFGQGETQYALRLFPLGGYVRLAGMDAPRDGSRPLGEDDPRSFLAKPIWQRAIIIAAGPVMNFVFGLALVVGYLYILALTTPPQIVKVLPDSPAAHAGLQAGDRLVAVDHVGVRSADAAVDRINAHGPGPLAVTIERKGKRLELSADPAAAGKGGPRLGVEVMGGPISPLTALVDGVRTTWNVTAATVGGLVGMIRGQQPAELAGPIGMSVLSAKALHAGIEYFISFAVLINVNLGLLNLLPIPILDGGGLLLLVIEGLRGRRLQPEEQGFAQVVGLAIILSVVLFATYQDIQRFIAPYFAGLLGGA
ncbi:MAG TPA: site-2 protease family protein [Limnochordia bacterium]|nr:site-2 protease family protein [Limnochordia bacterium]